MMQHEREFGFATRALHAGTPPDPATGSRAMPIYQTSAYVFGSTEQAAELFALRSYGHIYSRISNPTGRRVRRTHGEPRRGPRCHRVL